MGQIAQKARTQYVYDFATLDRVPEGSTSAKVEPRRLLSGATLETGKSSTVGAVLTGVTWDNTTCPDGTNSDVNGGTCEGHLI